MILDQGLEPKKAAQQWIRTHLKQVEPWLAGVKTRDGRNAFSVLNEKVASR
jgi:glycine betaine/proline transport system substrate-binding protein